MPLVRLVIASDVVVALVSKVEPVKVDEAKRLENVELNAPAIVEEADEYNDVVVAEPATVRLPAASNVDVAVVPKNALVAENKVEDA